MTATLVLRTLSFEHQDYNTIKICLQNTPGEEQ